MCVQKYAPAKAFDFILCQNENNKEVATNAAGCAQRLGIPADKVSACADGQGGKDLLLASFKRSKDKGAWGARRSSSPARSTRGAASRPS